MKNLTLEHIAEACGGIYHGAQGVCIAFPFLHISQVDEVLGTEVFRYGCRTETRGVQFQCRF